MRSRPVPPAAADDDKLAADGLPPLRRVIEDYELVAKRSLSQNFILDLNLTRRIAREAAPLDQTTVVEVGPGPGGLTRGLLMEGAKRVVAVERDRRCLEALGEIAAHYPGRLDVHEADALHTDWTELVGEDPGHVSIVANLPYGIATGLLVGWLEADPWPPWYGRMVLMFQKEVAERIVAEPNTKAYGRLAVLAQWRTRARIVVNLKPEAFTPPPKVSSAVVLFEPRAEPETACSVATLSRVTAAAFGQRRKMLRQSLRALTPMPELLLQKVGLAPELRAEAVTVRQFAELAAAFDG